MLMNVSYSEEHFIPLHQQLATNLESEILSGKYSQGELFATETSLVDRYRVSSTTVRRALQVLVQKGYLYRKAGKGTFIRRLQIEETLGPLSSFSEEMKILGLKPTSDLLAIKVLKANRLIAQKLQLAESEPIYRIKKLLRADDQPVAIFESYWPFDIGKDLAQFDLSTTNLYHLVENNLGINLGEAEATIEAGASSRKESQLLSIQEKDPVLIMQRTVYSTNGRPVYFARIAYRADRYKYRTRMVRGPIRSLRDWSNPANGTIAAMADEKIKRNLKTGKEMHQ
jgi:GntR family transcriptional regulator